MSYFSCTVAVAGFSSNSAVSVAIMNESASWWLYADLSDWNSAASLSVSGAPLLLTKFGMKSDVLTFGFSEPVVVSTTENDVLQEAGQQYGIVTPTTFAFNLHARRNGAAPLELCLLADAPVIAGFTFDKVTWYPITEEQTQIQWPK